MDTEYWVLERNRDDAVEIGLGTEYEARILSDPDVQEGIRYVQHVIEEWRRRLRDDD